MMSTPSWLWKGRCDCDPLPANHLGVMGLSLWVLEVRCLECVGGISTVGLRLRFATWCEAFCATFAQLGGPSSRLERRKPAKVQRPVDFYRYVRYMYTV